MSLLLDALKKAALDKQHREQNDSKYTDNKVQVAANTTRPISHELTLLHTGRDSKQDNKSTSNEAQPLAEIIAEPTNGKPLLTEQPSDSESIADPSDAVTESSVEAQYTNLELADDYSPFAQDPEDKESELSLEPSEFEIDLTDDISEFLSTSDADTINSDTINSDTLNSDTLNSDTLNSDTLNSDKTETFSELAEPILPGGGENKNVGTGRDSRINHNSSTSDHSVTRITKSDGNDGNQEQPVTKQSAESVAAAPQGKAATTQDTNEQRKQALNELLISSTLAAKRKFRRRLSAIVLVILVTALLLVSYYVLVIANNPTSTMLVNPSLVGSSVTAETNGLEAEAEMDLASNSSEVIASGDGSATLTAPANAQSESPQVAAVKPTATTQDGENAGHLNATAPMPSVANTKRQIPPATVEKITASKGDAKTTATKSVKAASSQPQNIIAKTEKPESQLSNEIHAGYDAWKKGDWGAAESHYAAAIRLDPKHRDALLGAAAVAVQQGNESKALSLYQQRLSRAPKDDYALAGLLGLVNFQLTSKSFESELNNLLEEFPEAAHLYYLKGALYASNDQWHAAQHAFFEAWKRDPSRPDYVFNLAVSMDQMGLYSEAMGFYQKALQLSETSAYNFSKPDLQTRLAQLQEAVQ